MHCFESKTHSFIIKIWLEEVDRVEGAKWRGRITHVPSGIQGYVEDLSGITNFIRPYLEQMSVKLGALRLLRRWLRRWNPLR